MKFLTILVCSTFLTLTSQVVTAQTSDRGVEALIILATVSNLAGDIEKRSYTLPSGEIRTIYDFNPKKYRRNLITQTTRLP